MQLEPICEAVHKAYCDERIRQGEEPYWTNGDYNKLDDATKEYDRVTVRAVLQAIKYEWLKELLQNALPHIECRNEFQSGLITEIGEYLSEP